MLRNRQIRTSDLSIRGVRSSNLVLAAGTDVIKENAKKLERSVNQLHTRKHYRLLLNSDNTKHLIVTREKDFSRRK